MQTTLADVNEQPDQKLVHYQPLVMLFTAFSIGIVLDRFWPQSAILWWCLAVATWLFWSLLWSIRRDRMAAWLLLLSLAASGASWHHTCWYLFDVNELGLVAREELQPVCVEAIALARPQRFAAPPANPMRTIPKGDQSRLSVRIVKVRNRNVWQTASGKADLRVDGHLLGIQPGDHLRLFANLGRAAQPRNPGEFDFARHQRTSRKVCQLISSNPACVTRGARGSSWNPRSLLSRLRVEGSTLLHRHLDPGRADLAAAILLGSREELDPDRTEAFFLTGSVHLLAISGLHVGILASAFLLIGRLGLVSRRRVLWCTILFVILYALLTDARPPVVRAAVLIVVVCWAQLLGRRALSFNSLTAAGLVVLAFSPAQLFQTGTQLSFLAVSTLIACQGMFRLRESQDPLDRLISRSKPVRYWVVKPAFRWVWGLFVTSTLIWLVALPLLLFRFHLFSTSAIFLNPIIWLPMAVALISGFGVLMFGWLFPPLAMLSGKICDYSLAWIETCVVTTRDITGSHFWTPGPALWWVIGFYAALISYLALPAWRPPRRWSVALLVVWITIGLCSNARLSSLQPNKDRPLHCTFLSVGHGTSVVLELPDGRTLLYDAGRLGSTTAGARSISAFLWSRGITRIDAAIVSHADADHYNALPELMERIEIGVVYVSPVMFERETNALTALQESFESAGVSIQHLYAGDYLASDSTAILEVLHPPRKGIIGSDNANSIVLRIDYAGRRILLPGDLESPGLNDVLAEEPLDCDVVMAPHHGSARSNPGDFASWSSPEWVIISGGFGHDLSQVRHAYGKAGANVLHTAEQGAVRVSVNPKGEISVRSWREEGW